MYIYIERDIDIDIDIYTHTYINLVFHAQMLKYMYKKPRHLFIKKLYFGFFQTFKDYIHINFKAINP